MHGYAEYGLMQVKLYEDIARFGNISITYDYPVLTNRRCVTSPTPIPKFDNPKMHDIAALQLFGARREKRIYAISLYTSVESPDCDDYPFLRSDGIAVLMNGINGRQPYEASPRFDCF